MARVGLSPSETGCVMAPSGFLLQPFAASVLMNLQSWLRLPRLALSPAS